MNASAPASASSLPYCGAAPLPADLWARWNLDPWLLAGFVLALLLWRWRGRAPSENWAYGAALAILFVAFVSPLCALTSALYAARSAHHLLLVTIAAPLLALAGIGRGLRIPAGPAALSHILIFWAWHVPAAYGWALSSDGAYWLMQASLVGSGLAFWAAALSPRLGPASLVALLIAMMAQMGMLGALLTFAPEPLYAWHLATTAPFGIGPLEDQQLAGLVMWVVSLPLYLLAALAVVGRRARLAGATA